MMEHLMSNSEWTCTNDPEDCSRYYAVLPSGKRYQAGGADAVFNAAEASRIHRGGEDPADVLKGRQAAPAVEVSYPDNPDALAKMKVSDAEALIATLTTVEEVTPFLAHEKKGIKEAAEKRLTELRPPADTTTKDPADTDSTETPAE